MLPIVLNLLPAWKASDIVATPSFATHIKKTYIYVGQHIKTLPAYTFNVPVGKASTEGTRKNSGREQSSGLVMSDHGEAKGGKKI